MVGRYYNNMNSRAKLDVMADMLPGPLLISKPCRKCPSKRNTVPKLTRTLPKRVHDYENTGINIREMQIKTLDEVQPQKILLSTLCTHCSDRLRVLATFINY